MTKSLSPWSVLHRTTAYQSKFITIEEVNSSRENHPASTFFRLHLPDWVNIIPITAQGELLLIEQYRHGSQSTTLEIPGGVIDKDEPPKTAAMRELKEETGFGGGEWVSLGAVHPNPAIQVNQCHVFLAKGVTLLGDTDFDDDEEIILHPTPLSQLGTLIADHKITNAIVLSAILKGVSAGMITL